MICHTSSIFHDIMFFDIDISNKVFKVPTYVELVFGKNIAFENLIVCIKYS